MEEYESFLGLGINSSGAKQNAELKLENWKIKQKENGITILEVNRNYETKKNTDIEWQCEINLKYKKQ